jgi:D-alanine-D-alanine ligase-like ATP-grasp enzyme
MQRNMTRQRFPRADQVPLGEFYNLSTHLIAMELLRRGIEVTWLTPRFCLAYVGGTTLGYEVTATHATGHAGTRAASRKDLARTLLATADLVVADGQAFSPVDGQAIAAEYARTIGPVVVKPVDGNKGRGVTVGVEDPAKFDRAWELAARETRRGILVERQFTGTEGRFLVVGGRCISVTKRIPPHVVGNGVDSVGELIVAKNDLRRQNPVVSRYPIIMDAHRLDRLRQQGYDLDDVPANGETLILDLKAGLSTGAEGANITDDVHPSYLDIAASAASVFPGLDVAGVDIIAQDFAEPANGENHIICEVNHAPGIGSHHFPTEGRARDVAGAIVDFHLSKVAAHSRSQRLAAPVQLRSAPSASHALSALENEPVDSSVSNAELIALELTRRGVTVTWLTSQHFVADVHGVRFGYWGTATHLTGRAGVKLVARRDLVRQVLSAAGYNVPRGRQFSASQPITKAQSYAMTLGRTTIGPIDGRGGKGITVGVKDADEFTLAWSTAVRHTDRSILVEQCADGTTARFLVVGHQCAGVLEDATDVSDRVHQSFKEIAVVAVRVLPGLDIAEVEIVARDFADSAHSDGYVVTDVRSRPDIVPYHSPAGGRDVARMIVDLHVAEAATSTDGHATPI